VEPAPHTLIAALRHSHERLASLVNAVSEDFLSSRSYCADWSVAQVLSHLGSGAEIASLMLSSVLTGEPMDREAFAPVWDVWNAKTPAQQAADAVPADDAYISRLEGLTGDELDGISFEFFGMTLDAAGLVGMRLSEHAIHTWDVASAIDPVAVVAPDAVALLYGRVSWLAERTGRQGDGPLRARLVASDSEADFLLDVTDKVTLVPWPAEGGPADGEIHLPAEALLRLFYGRLGDEVTPTVEISGDPALLGRIRAVFPGY
jgi:uncharacterized protein (TIGR03083 family)